jgi:malonyl-CoA/methylmalonyl-CoA synthetase
VPVGEIGGIQVKGPNVFGATGACPRRRPKSSRPTASSRPATWARIDERGYVTIVGRSKDLIISGGYNVYPAEIEGYINECPAWPRAPWSGCRTPTSAKWAWRWSLPSPAPRSDGPTPSLAELKAKLANFKIPKRCFVVSELPRNTMGKVQKNLLRDQYAKLFT